MWTLGPLPLDGTASSRKTFFKVTRGPHTPFRADPIYRPTLVCPPHHHHYRREKQRILFCFTLFILFYFVSFLRFGNSYNTACLSIPSRQSRAAQVKLFPGCRWARRPPPTRLDQHTKTFFFSIVFRLDEPNSYWTIPGMLYETVSSMSAVNLIDFRILLVYFLPFV